MKYGTEALDFVFEGATKKVITREGTYLGRAVIVATGTQRKKLQLPGETEYIGRGVSYCPMCDGPLYRGLQVAVVGSGNEAFEDAVYIAGRTSKVFLVTHSPEIKADQTLLDEAKEKANLKIIMGRVNTINGDQTVTSISYNLFDKYVKQEITVDGVFVSLGGVPMTAVVKKAGVKVDERGCIKVNRQQFTNLKGVYAAGDCTCGGMQIITAAGEGAMAGINAYRFVKKLESN
jgi:thioredoxin reductase (NADPH)